LAPPPAVTPFIVFHHRGSGKVKLPPAVLQMPRRRHRLPGFLAVTSLSGGTWTELIRGLVFTELTRGNAWKEEKRGLVWNEPLR
jgi:hypothetical protein